VSGVRVFVAGGSGVLGRRLVPKLVARGHRVTATTTGPGRLGLLEDLGAHGIVLDGLDGAAVGEAVATAHSDAIVHLMTALSPAHAGAPDVGHLDQWFGPTTRLRTEGTENLLAAAEATDVPRVVAQSHASWHGIREGGWVKTEDDPLDMHEGTVHNPISVGIRHLEEVVLAAGGAVLRCGSLYGAASDEMVETVRRRRFHLVRPGNGHWSWVHLDDAARATVLAVERQARGLYNVVDDEPAPAKDWLPHLAVCVGAEPPRRISPWLARMLAGDVPVIAMTEGRGFSNSRARRELGWAPHYRSWRQGFEEGLG
jgi:nucleoside-diphosphate-sugar epimerase